jgi:hypothetical protein
MSWLRLNDQGGTHPKVAYVGNEAYGAWCRMAQWSSAYGTNGFVPEVVALWFAGKKRVLERLLSYPRPYAVGLLERREDGYVIHDFQQYNPSAQEVEERREALSEARRAAGRVGGLRSAEARAKHAATKVEAKGKQAVPQTQAGAMAGCSAGSKQYEAPSPSPIPKDPSDLSPQPPAAGVRAHPEAVLDVSPARSAPSPGMAVNENSDDGEGEPTAGVEHPDVPCGAPSAEGDAPGATPAAEPPDPHANEVGDSEPRRGSSTRWLPTGLVRHELSFWVATYERSVASVLGHAWGLPKEDIPKLEEVAEKFCTGDSRKNIDAWFERAVTAFATAIRRRVDREGDELKYWSSLRPAGLYRWLNEGRPGHVVRVVKRAPSPPRPEEPPMSAEDMRAHAEALQRSLQRIGQGGAG